MLMPLPCLMYEHLQPLRDVLLVPRGIAQRRDNQLRVDFGFTGLPLRAFLKPARQREQCKIT